VINPAVSGTLEHVGVTDPQPTVDTSAQPEGVQP